MLPGYAELHCRSNFSFGHGASHPEELVGRAHALGYAALAVTDECSLSGVVRAAGAVIAPLLILFIALWVVRVPLSFWAAERYGPDGIWWSFALSALLSMLMTVAYYLHGGWKRARMTSGAPAAGAAVAGGEGS